MRRPFAVHKTRPVICIEVGPRAPGQGKIDPGRERVALIVVEEEVACVRRLEIGKASADAARALRILMRVGGVELNASGHAWRGCGAFPAADAGTIDGERKEDMEFPRTS